jgi:hypothetical protein
MNWLHSFWFHYEWPSDQGNGPEAVSEMLAVAFSGSLLIPRVRRWWGRHIEDLKKHVSSENAALHDKLDRNIELSQHIIKHHPDIPPMVHRDGLGKFKKRN